MRRERGRGYQRCEPDLLAVTQTDSRNTTGTQPKISIVAVSRAAPDDLAAELFRVRHKRRFPQQGALVIGIMGPDVSALLAGDKNIASAGKSHQNRGRTEV